MKNLNIIELTALIVAIAELLKQIRLIFSKED